MPGLLILCEFPTLLGGERSMLATLPHVRAAGLDTVVAAPPVGPLRQALDERGLESVPLQVRNEDGVRHPLATIHGSLGRMIDRLRPDIVHANSLAMGRLSGPVVKQIGVPSVAHLRDILRLSRPAVADLNHHDCLIAVSGKTRAFHVDQGIERRRTIVLHNGVDLDLFRPNVSSRAAGVSRPVPVDSPRIVTIGQLGMRKGIDRVLEAAKYVLAQHPTARFLVVGDRTSDKEEARAYEDQLRKTAAEPPLAGRVHFLGARDDVPQILSESAVFVHAARQEPLGRVLLEAAASGTPIVATCVGGTDEIFPAACQAALLVDADRSDDVIAQDLAHAVLRVLDNPPLADRLSANAGRRIATCFSAERAARKLLRVYDCVLAR